MVHETQQLLATIVFLVLLLLLLVVTELLHKRFHWPIEHSRKFMHVAGGVASLCLPLFISNYHWVIIITSIAFLLLFITYLKKWLGSVHQVQRSSVGSILFPIPVGVCFVIAAMSDNWLYFYLPIALLTFADTMAEIVGVQWGQRSKLFFNGQKSLMGAIAFFITGMMVTLITLSCFSIPATKAAWLCVVIALCTAVTELVSLKGWDNLSVPLVTIALLYWLL